MSTLAQELTANALRINRLSYQTPTCHPERKDVILNLFQDPPKEEIYIMKAYWVYILASQKNGTLYIGVTNDLERRIIEHKQELTEGFSKMYDVKMLVYFEQTPDVDAAIAREKQLKNWHRQWKINLVQSVNPEWKDLSLEFMDAETSSAWHKLSLG